MAKALAVLAVSAVLGAGSTVAIIGEKQAPPEILLVELTPAAGKEKTVSFRICGRPVVGQGDAKCHLGKLEERDPLLAVLPRALELWAKAEKP